MTESTKWLWLSGGVITLFLLYLLAPILTPFMVAAILAYMGDPLVDRLEKWRLTRTTAVMVVFFGLGVIMVSLLVIVVPMLERQVKVLTGAMPQYIDTIQHQLLPWLQQRFGIEVQLDSEQIKQSLTAHWREAGGVAGTLMTSLTRSSMAVLGWLANLLLIPVVTFYLLRDWDVLVARLHEMLPRRFEPMIVQLSRSSDEVLGAFFRGQLMVMLALAVFYSLGLEIAGLDLAILLGITAGLLSFVPYLGLIVGVVFACIAALLQFHDLTHLIYIAIVFGIGQLLEGMVLTPWLVGNRIGLHPVAVIFAVLAGGQLFGFFGILVALPAAAVVVVILRYVHEKYLASHLYSKL